MNLILTAAGKYSRFKEAGYNIPKYLLPIGNRSILSEILHHLAHNPVIENIYLIANYDDKPFFGHVKKIMEAHGISRENLIMMADTKGQAETAYKALKHINPKGAVLFHNIDTILYNRNLEAIAAELKECDGYIDVFRSQNHAYSYVVEKDGVVSMISEKVLVSDLATSGLYGFRDAEEFTYHEDGFSYISEVYKDMIKFGRKVRIGKVHDEKDTLVLGTPEDYFKYSVAI